MFKHLKPRLDGTTTQDDTDTAPAPVTNDISDPVDSGTAATTEDPLATDDTEGTVPEPDPDLNIVDDDPEIVEIIADSDDVAVDSDEVSSSAEALQSCFESIQEHGPSKTVIEFALKAKLVPVVTEAVTAVESISDVGEMTEAFQEKSLEALSGQLSQMEEKTKSLVNAAYEKILSDVDMIKDSLSAKTISGRCSEESVLKSLENLNIRTHELSKIAGSASTLSSSKKMLAADKDKITDLTSVSIESADWSGDALHTAFATTLPKLTSAMKSLNRAMSVIPKGKTSLESLNKKAVYLGEVAAVVKGVMSDFAVSSAVNTLV